MIKAPSGIRVLVHRSSARIPGARDFLALAKGPQHAPKADPIRDQIIALRKQN